MAAATDQLGNLHVMWNDRDAAGVIYYSRRSDAGWTRPVDVLVTPDNALPRNLRLAVDSMGMLRLVWNSARGYFASAPALEAESPHAWEQPTAFSPEQIVGADITVAVDGTLHILYSRTGNNVYHVASDDGGANWSEPTAVSIVIPFQAGTNWPRIAAGPGNQLYAAWTEVALPDGWPPLGVYFAASPDEGVTWSTPVLIDEGGYDQITVAAGAQDDVYLAWNGMAGAANLPSVGGRYFQWSSDSGTTWSPKTILTAEGFTSGNPEMKVDSANVLHLISHFRGVNYASWEDAVRTPWVDLTAPIRESVGFTESPVLVVSSGNVLHVLFPDSKGRVWHTSRTTAAPRVGPTPFATQPAPAATPVPTQISAAETMPTVTRSPVIDTSPQGGQISRNRMTPVYVSLLPVIVLLGAVFFVFAQRIRR